jgi:hypothetical protein
MSFKEELLRRAREYTQRRGLVLGDELGTGVHGTVFATESQPEKGPAAVRSAIKVHQRQPDYLRERDVYLRLRDQGVKSIRGCHVPQLLHLDDELQVLEMTVVTRPYALDFAGAFLDQPPDFPEKSWRSGAPRKRSSLAPSGPRWWRSSGCWKATASTWPT